MFLVRSVSNRLAWSWASATRAAFVLLALCGIVALASPAQARIFIGVGVPFYAPPVVIPGPYYYPPYYYGPPAVYAPQGNNFSYTPPQAQPQGQPQNLAPPQGYAPPPPGYPQQPSYSPGGYTPTGGYTPSMGGGGSDATAQSCRAGAYVCPLVEDTPLGGACTCPGHNGQQIRGQAN
jgi:hypothetical protein